MTVYTFQPDEAAGLDNYLWSNGGNNGTANNMYIGFDGTYKGRPIITFSQLSDGTIPAGLVVDSVVLSLYGSVTSANKDDTANVYRCKMNWSESQSTWSIYSTGNNWQTAGASGANDRESTSIGSAAMNHGDAAKWYDFTLTNQAIKDIISGTWTNHGFIVQLAAEAGTSLFSFVSSSGTAANRPKIVVTGHMPALAVCIY
jgi:hypothetical protein